jgi:hypothetical protein
MPVLMGVLRSRDGVYYLRKKVPATLEQAVSTVFGAPRPRTSWLKRSLRTKDVREANIRAKPVLIEFDRVLARAVLQLRDVPRVVDLSDVMIERMADYLYAWVLEEDDDLRREGTGSEELFQEIAGNFGRPAFPYSVLSRQTGRDQPAACRTGRCLSFEKTQTGYFRWRRTRSREGTSPLSGSNWTAAREITQGSSDNARHVPRHGEGRKTFSRRGHGGETP